jgi:hypothetical protein
MGFDQMMLFYEQAVVVKSRIEVRFYSAASTVQSVGIVLTPDAVLPVLPDVVENGLIVMDYVIGTATDGYHGSATLELECDVGKYFGRTRRELITSPEFYTTAAANPTEQCYFQVVTWNPAGATNTAVSFDVFLSYDIFYYEPRKDTSSLVYSLPAQQQMRVRVTSRFSKLDATELKRDR